MLKTKALPTSKAEENEKLEVTEAMRRAGANAFDYDPEYESLEEALERAYREMELVRRGFPPEDPFGRP